MEKEKIIELWKQLGVTSVEFEFSCGGDSMNDTNMIINTDKGTISNDEIESYIDDEVYKNVDFYVNSDGHYQGEAGIVLIELEDADEDEPYFSYSKQAESEWSEQVTNECLIRLTEKEIAFVNKYISRIGGDDGDINFAYKGDIFLNDEDEDLLTDLGDKICEEVRDFSPDIDEGELQDYYTFNSSKSDIDSDIKIVGNDLIIYVDNTITVYRESD